MAKRTYLTVPEELLDLADQIADGFELRGYEVEVEPRELGYPYTPTLRCARDSGRTTMMVEVAATLPMEKLEEWTRFGKSASRDTRVAAGIPADVSRSAQDDAKLRSAGVGIYIPLDSGALMEVAPPQDLAMNVELPEPGRLPSSVRAALGSAFEQFERSNWREGFGDACQVVETHARRYLVDGVDTGRITLVPGKKGYVPDAAAIDAMTLGQLAFTFDRIQAPNRIDALIGQALQKLNQDRVGEAHLKAKQQTEERLRLNVGSHMWIVVDALKMLLS